MFDVLSQLRAIAESGGHVPRTLAGHRRKKHHTFKKDSKPRELYDLIRTYHQTTEVFWTAAKVHELWGWSLDEAKNALYRLHLHGYLVEGGKVGAFKAYRFEGEK
jgi:hypothetical protein